jgi:hypothetical protein
MIHLSLSLTSEHLNDILSSVFLQYTRLQRDARSEHIPYEKEELEREAARIETLYQNLMIQAVAAGFDPENV